jgi:hypothetical protein
MGSIDAMRTRLNTCFWVALMAELPASVAAAWPCAAPAAGGWETLGWLALSRAGASVSMAEGPGAKTQTTHSTN